MRPYSDTGLTISPQASPASPAVRILRAAFTSRSWTDPHSGQPHSRRVSGNAGRVRPQSWHRLLLGYQRPIPTTVRPYQVALYSSWCKNSPHPASEMDFARLWFFFIWQTARLSTAITWFSRTIRPESWWRKWERVSVMRVWIRATLSRAVAPLADPFCFLAVRLWSLPRRASYLRNTLGDPTFSPVDKITKWLRPKPIPTWEDTWRFGLTVSSHNSETKYRPAASFETAAVVILAALGRVRDQTITKGSVIFASVRAFPDHVKALTVYSADRLSHLDLKSGDCGHFAKKLAKAVWRWRNDCYRGTLKTSLSQEYSGSFFNSVSVA